MFKTYIHRVGMGNTEESLVLLTLGVKQRGLPSDRAFDHTTNIGYVPPHDGHYSDGLAKGNTILLLISEIFGAVNGVSLRFLTRLAHRFKGCKDIKYHDRGGREVSFFLHYARAISTAAAIGHARVLVPDADRNPVSSGAAARMRGPRMLPLRVFAPHGCVFRGTRMRFSGQKCSQTCTVRTF